MKKIAVIGAGGNAREIAGLIRDLGWYEFLGFLSDMAGEYDTPAIGDFEWLRENRVDCLAMGIGSPERKLSLGRELAMELPHVAWPALVHPTAYVGRSSKFERGVIVCANATVTENVRIKEFAQLNVACTVGHEAVIGAGALINPGANISGGVVIEEGVMVGTGAQILQYKTLGRNAVVGAGAVVIRDVKRCTTVVGVPATDIRLRRSQPRARSVLWR